MLEKQVNRQRYGVDFRMQNAVIERIGKSGKEIGVDRQMQRY